MRMNSLISRGTILVPFLLDLSEIPRFKVETRDFPVPFREEVTRIDLNARGSRGESLGWNIWLENTVLRDLPRTGGGDTLSLTLRADSRRMDIYSLRYEDSISLISGNGHFRTR